MYCIADFVIALFVQVDDALREADLWTSPDVRAKLAPSEIVTLGLLQVLKGKNQSAFYRWALMNLRHFFPGLPERTRLFRLLTKYQALADAFLAQATQVGYADSFGMELIHPRREGRSDRQVGKKGLSNHRRNIAGLWASSSALCLMPKDALSIGMLIPLMFMTALFRDFCGNGSRVVRLFMSIADSIAPQNGVVMLPISRFASAVRTICG